MKNFSLTPQRNINWVTNKNGVGQRWVNSWDFLKKSGKHYHQIKNYGPESDDLNKIIEKIAYYELDNPDHCPQVIREMSAIEEWKAKETIPTKNNSKLIKKFKIANGDNITLYDEGKFKAYCVLDENIYLENPWLKLVSLEEDNIIAMSLNTLIQKLNTNEHKKLNYPIVFDVIDMASYWRTIGHLLKHSAILRIRTTPKTRDLLFKLYERVTGYKISKDMEEKYVDHNPNLQTFTDNAHLYFPTVSKEVRELLHFPSNRVGRNKGKISNSVEKIHNTEFVWTLFSYGFRLGDDHDSEKIYNHVETNANEFIAAFKEGNDKWLI